MQSEEATMVLTFLSRYRDLGLLILRLGLGTMFIAHGGPKLMGGPEMWRGLGGAMGNLGVTTAPAFWGFMAGFAEAGGGVCLILGLFVRPACMLLLTTMLVAAKHHFTKGDGLMGAAHAIESAVVFLSLILIGPGKYSIDGE
jgi:putative oxidoreductase